MSQINTDLKQATAILKAGGLVAMPTETVYGLAADASNPLAVKKVFAAKGRPADHPLIVHIADITQLNNWAREIPEIAYALFSAFSPGPLTLILKKAPGVLDIVTGGQDTVGIRIPSHPIAQALLKSFNGGLAAPSANRFGRISPTEAIHVKEELGDKVDLILDGGPSEVGIESTIVDVSTGSPRILRLGIISQTDIEKVLGRAVEVKIQAKPGETPRVSGSLLSHYAPCTPLEILSTDKLINRLTALRAQGLKCCAISHHQLELAPNVPHFSLPNEQHAYAKRIYATLRNADALKLDRIVIEEVPSEWLAIADRLARAAK